MRAGDGGVHLVEALEEALLFILGDSRAGVAHMETHGAALRRDLPGVH